MMNFTVDRLVEGERLRRYGPKMFVEKIRPGQKVPKIVRKET
jgi:hypothetical protein